MGPEPSNPPPDPWAGWFSGKEEDRQTPALVAAAPALAFPKAHSAQSEGSLLGAVLDTTGALVVVLDRQGSIVRLNRSAEQAAGYDLKEVRGRPYWEVFLRPEDADAARQAFEQLRSAGDFPSRHESYWRTKDGQRRWVAWSNTAVRDDSGQVEFIIETGVDLTERQQAREALAWEAGVNAAVAELSGALISLASLDDVSALVLEQAKRLTESAHGFVGYIDPQSGAFVPSALTWDVGAACQVPSLNLDLHEFGGLGGWVLQHRRPLLSNDPANDPRAAGAPAGHLPIQRFLAVPAMLGTTLVGQVAVANTQRDYTERDLDLVQRLAQLYALAIQRQRADEALHQHALELQAQNAELDTFAHTVAHELKAPLTLAQGYAQLLALRYDALSVTERQAAVQEILKASQRMNRIIKEILLLASIRQEDVTIGPLDMARIVSDSLEQMADLIEQYQPEILVPQEWPAALGYAFWVEEIWANYFSNGLKYGGRPPRLELGAAAEAGGTIRFWVRDNGAGLAPDEQARLFAPFARSQRVRAQGHGLGLSIVRHIVERLGGQVGVESTPGRGSTFYFALPAACTSAE